MGEKLNMHNLPSGKFLIEVVNRNYRKSENLGASHDEWFYSIERLVKMIRRKRAKNKKGEHANETKK